MDDENQSYVLFGRDIFKVPCLRNSFLYSISSYVGVGLATFLFTSRPRLASHTGFTAFVVVTFGYYIDCRIKYNKTQHTFAEIQNALHKAAIMEGTDSDINFQKIKKLPPVEDV